MRGAAKRARRAVRAALTRQPPGAPRFRETGPETTQCTAICDMQTQRRIVPLAPALASKLRAGSTIQSLSQAAEECICNSIDAGARHIHVLLSTRDLSLTVTDDGRGITADSFGCLAQQHATSKAPETRQPVASARSFGYRGTALASMAQSGRRVSCLLARPKKTAL